jgi:hypothetical protein
LAFRSAAGLYLGEVCDDPNDARSTERSGASTDPSWLMSGVLETVQAPELVVVKLQLVARVKGVEGIERMNLTTPLVPKLSEIVNVLEKMVAPVVAFTAITLTVPVSVMVVVSSERLAVKVIVTSSKVTVLLREIGMIVFVVAVWVEGRAIVLCSADV